MGFMYKKTHVASDTISVLEGPGGVMLIGRREGTYVHMTEKQASQKKYQQLYPENMFLLHSYICQKEWLDMIWLLYHFAYHVVLSYWRRLVVLVSLPADFECFLHFQQQILQHIG